MVSAKMNGASSKMISIVLVSSLGVDEPSSSVDVLDLTITINDGSVITRKYQKPVDLYQYITPN